MAIVKIPSKEELLKRIEANPSDRLFFEFSNIHQDYKNLLFLKERYITWFSLVLETKFFELRQEEISLPDSLKLLRTHKISKEFLEQIEEQWKTNYIQKILKNLNSPQKEDQFFKFKQELNDTVRTHILIIKDNRTVAHSSYKIIRHNRLQKKVLSTHRWVDGQLTKNERKLIHLKFNQIQQKHNIGIVVGINLNNQKYLERCLLNNFKIFRMGVLKIE